MIHAALVDVDEEGTEAAATAMAFAAKTTMPGDEPVVFRADHPFLFLIAPAMLIFLRPLPNLNVNNHQGRLPPM